MTSRLPEIRADVSIGFVDARGRVFFDPAWFRTVMTAIYERLGGEMAMTNIDLEQLFALGPLAEPPRTRQDPFEALTPAPDVAIPLVDPHARIESIEATVARLQRQIQDLQQGTAA